MIGHDLQVTGVQFVAADGRDRRTGLLGWISCVVNGALVLDGIALRRTRSGRLRLSFPARRDSRGILHHHIRPLDDFTRRDLERQVFELLALEVAS